MATIQGIYLALFGRPADPAGLAYFNGLTNNGTNLAGISNLSGQPEYTSRFTGLTNEQIVNAIYQALFGRDAEPAGLSFYVGQLAAGKLSINTIAINILDGAAGNDKANVDAKIAAANLFTNSLDTPAEIAAYSGNAAAALARAYISGVNANNPGTEAGVNAAIQSVVTSGGQAPGGGGGGGGTGEGPGEPEPGSDKVNSYGDLTATYGDNELYAGHGNPANGFAKSVSVLANIELGLDVRYNQDPTEVAPAHDTTWTVDKDSNARLAYSVATLNGQSLDLATYDYKLLIDTDSSIGGTNFLTLTLGPDAGGNTYDNNHNSAYDWYDADGIPYIQDDGGNDAVSQNVQIIPPVLGEYEVKLQALLKGTDTTVAESKITIEVNDENVIYDVAGDDATDVARTVGNAGPDHLYWIKDRAEVASLSYGTPADPYIQLNVNGNGVDVYDDPGVRKVPYYSYQGIKLRDNDTPSSLNIAVTETKSVFVKFGFNIESGWSSDDHGQAASFWPFVITDFGGSNSTFYPILEYLDGDASEVLAQKWNADDDTVAGNSGFRIWDSQNAGSWGQFEATDVTGWVDVELLIETDHLMWTVSQNGAEIFAVTQDGDYASNSINFSSFAFEASNFGQNEAYQIRDLRIGTIEYPDIL